MVLADDRILEYIQENGTGTAKEMVEDDAVRYTGSYVTQRCKQLVDHGLLKHLGNGVYAITDLGEKYLSGELDTSESELKKHGIDVDCGNGNGPSAPA